MKIAVAAGTRPEFIQVEPLIRELTKQNVEYISIHSGQHYDYEMDQIFFEEMNLPCPTHYLNIGSKSPCEQIGDLILKSEKIFQTEKPDILLISGDTNTTLGIALAANKSKIRIGHMEAGMRSFDRTMPEEINRIIVDNISDVLLSPTKRGVENLKDNGIIDNVYLVGDIMLDSIIYYRHLIDKKPGILDELGFKCEKYLVLTLHRESNTDSLHRLTNIIDAVSQTNFPVIFPIHPRTRDKLTRSKIRIPENVHIIPPAGYFEFLRLLSHSYKLLTDSGGAQKQAFFLKKPCITLRPNTEWVETLEYGWNILVDDSKEKILNAIENSIPPDAPRISQFGDGTSSEKIFEAVTTFIRARKDL
ncbi:MAG: UDP-N-acetylglucosamine 2-epimerase (non-hydrolyzing) [Methanoregula sp.]|jgi:UDP-N-acetylglucosamine 2-epimerase (non-hydrolysing)